MAIEIAALFLATLIKMSKRVGPELIDDLWQNLRDQFGLSMSGDRKRVGSQRSLRRMIFDWSPNARYAYSPTLVITLSSPYVRVSGFENFKKAKICSTTTVSYFSVGKNLRDNYSFMSLSIHFQGAGHPHQ